MYKYDGELTQDQKKVFDAIMEGENVLLLGLAGCGKSFLISNVIKELHAQRKNVVVTAPTGIAALNIESGITIHRAFGIKPQPVFSTLYTPSASNVAGMDVLIIDEISMVRCDLFDSIMRAVVNLSLDKPIKVILVGDFFQLPPVITTRDEEVFHTVYPDATSGYAFEGEMWDMFDFVPHILTKSIRQADQSFVDELNRARMGDNSCVPYFNKRVKADNGNDAIRLYGTNNKADVYNKMRLSKLKTEKKTYVSECDGEVKDSDKPVPDSLTLAVGARVMCVANDNTLHQYVNGSFGTVTRLDDRAIEVSFDNGNIATVGYNDWEILNAKSSDTGDGKKRVETESVGTYSQIPFKLGYAITMHKSQGQTYDACTIDPHIFSDGQLYVALSRCRTIDGVSLLSPIKANSLKASQTVIDFYERI